MTHEEVQAQLNLSVPEVRRILGAIGYQKPFTVIFTKANGEQRKMHCMMEVPTGKRPADGVVPVMDLDKGAWRSFKLDSVLSITTGGK